MSFRLVLCLLFITSSYLYASTNSDFDSVIFNSNLVNEPVQAGYGTQFLLNMRTSPKTFNNPAIIFI